MYRGTITARKHCQPYHNGRRICPHFLTACMGSPVQAVLHAAPAGPGARAGKFLRRAAAELSQHSQYTPQSGFFGVTAPNAEARRKHNTKHKKDADHSISVLLCCIKRGLGTMSPAGVNMFRGGAPFSIHRRYNCRHRLQSAGARLLYFIKLFSARYALSESAALRDTPQSPCP